MNTKQVFIGTLAVMGLTFSLSVGVNFHRYNTKTQVQKVKALESIQELKSWIEEDRFNGTLKDDVAELYQEELTELENTIK